MITLEKLTKTIPDGVLDRLYQESLEDILKITEQDAANLKELYALCDKLYKSLINMIEKRITADIEVKTHLKNSINAYTDTLTEIGTYFHEKSYKAGVIDGVRFLLEAGHSK